MYKYILVEFREIYLLFNCSNALLTMKIVFASSINILERSCSLRKTTRQNSKSAGYLALSLSQIKHIMDIKRNCANVYAFPH